MIDRFAEYDRQNLMAARLIMHKPYPPEYIGVQWAKLILERDNRDDRSKSEANGQQ